MGLSVSKPDGARWSDSDTAGSPACPSSPSPQTNDWAHFSGLASRAGSPARTSAAFAKAAMPVPRMSLGTLPGALQREDNAPLEEHQIQQAAYHLATHVVGDPITSPKRLAAAGQTVHDVRTLLKHGRGNVRADNVPSNGHNGIGSSVAAGGEDNFNRFALAAVMGAAVCEHHAGLAAAIHAPHMDPSERVVNARADVKLHKVADEGSEFATRACHIWNELRRESDGRNKRSTIVMDPWANGPAVRLKDSAWRKASVDNEYLSLGKDDAAQLKNDLEMHAPRVHPDEDEDTAFRLNMRRHTPTEWQQYAEAQIVSGRFAKKARIALSAVPPEEQQELASRMVRDAYGLTPNETVHQDTIQSVLETAHQLDKLPRPPVVPPEN